MPIKVLYSETKRVGNPICPKCSRKYGIGYLIKDEIWNKLPKKMHHEGLCLECFLEELEKVAPKQKLGLNDFIHLSFRGDYRNPKFGGPIIMGDNKKRRIYLD
jgi:hypothetical protein